KTLTRRKRRSIASPWLDVGRSHCSMVRTRQRRLPMPKIRLAPDLEMHYRVDDFTDPWSTPDPILLLHGNAESGAAWYRWVPVLGRRFRVVRPDMRGFGQSTPMPRDYP